MKTGESLYIKILLWCYEQQDGFTEPDLMQCFDIKQGDWKYSLYLKVFKTGTNDNSPMIIHMRNHKDIAHWCLSEKGMSAAIDYLELQEVKDSSKKAMCIAISSLLLTSVVGIIQICIQLFF